MKTDDNEVEIDTSHLKPAPTSFLSPEDVIDMGYDCSKMTQEEFEAFAREIGENEGLMGSWWLALENAAENRNLSKIEE